MASTGRKYRIVGQILVIAGYFIGLAYLVMLFLLAFSYNEGMFNFWELLVLPGWPWVLAAGLSIIAGCLFIVIDELLQKHEEHPKTETEAARIDQMPAHVHAPVEYPVEL